MLQNHPPLVLASASPRRQALLKEAGFDFEIRVQQVDESFPDSTAGKKVAEFLARKKSDAYDRSGEEILITADTVVCLEDEILNKPADSDEARSMLRKLSGKTHEVITGVCLRDEFKQHSFREVTTVSFKPLNSDEIEYYLENYQPFDKAGGYGIQEWIGLIGVKRVEGCYNNVVGFPLSRFYRELEAFIQ